MKRGKILKEGTVKCEPECRERLKRDKFVELRPPSLSHTAYEVKFENTDTGFNYSYYEYFWDATGVYDFSDKLSELRRMTRQKREV